MYVNAKMIPVETVPGIRREGRKEGSGGGEFKYDIFAHCKNLCKCYNASPPSTTIIKKMNIWINGGKKENYEKIYDSQSQSNVKILPSL
jgi:hypothetical protein